MKIYNILSILALILCATGCKNESNKRIEDTRNLNPFEYTQLSYTAKDSLGREFSVSDLHKENKEVGIFYHVWHGYKHAENKGIFDVTKLLQDNPNALYNLSATEEDSPLGAFHYWGEPLYGYYRSDDPWVITRHMELLTAAGVDYLCYDLTNATIYYDAINEIFKVLDKFQKQGFKVPKVCFYTNSDSGVTMKACYETWYERGLYSNLWYSRDGEKPLIIGRKYDLQSKFPRVYEEMIEKMDIRESQWPDERFDVKEGFPWMDWDYPQRIFRDGTISVSVGQHPGCNCAKPEGTKGRGFDYASYENNTEKVAEGTNFESQYSRVFENEDKINNVFLTGFNEWIAIKQDNGSGELLMVDTFNEEFSRDIEMFRGYKDQKGYGDNFVMQMMRLNKRFKTTEGRHYIYNEKTIDINDFSSEQWENIKSVYMDFAGDAIARNFKNYDRSKDYVDVSNRNDIVKTTVTHDSNNLYFRVECLENITVKEETDKTWMNILINANLKNATDWNGYNFIINRDVINGKGSIEALDENFNTTVVGEADIKVEGKIMQVAIPLSLIGKSETDAYVSFKVCDHVSDQEDIMEYYVSGDSAPIGRINYAYGY
ncbi:MAG: hypothetical protein HUJ59_01935 [Bacilli bacterium]|nr:hypothetical protein [Bacilli bacterium]